MHFPANHFIATRKMFNQKRIATSAASVSVTEEKRLSYAALCEDKRHIINYWERVELHAQSHSHRRLLLKDEHRRHRQEDGLRGSLQ